MHHHHEMQDKAREMHKVPATMEKMQEMPQAPTTALVPEETKLMLMGAQVALFARVQRPTPHLIAKEKPPKLPSPECQMCGQVTRFTKK